MHTPQNGSPIRRRFFPPLFALVLSGLFIWGWFSIVSANQGEINLSPLASYELSINKTQNPPDFFTANSDNNYYMINITRVNTEPIGANSFYVYDSLPTGMTWTPADQPGWICDNGISTEQLVNCWNSQMITGTTPIKTLLIKVNVGDIAGKVTNIASIHYGDRKKSSSIVTTVTNGADLQISKVVTPTLALNEDTGITYYLTVTNNGPKPTNIITVTDVLPNDLKNYSFTQPIAATFFTVTNNSIVTGTWIIPTPLQVGSSLRIIVNAVPKSGTSGKTITNKATVASDQPDWNPNNNSANASLTIGGMEISKGVKVESSPVKVGQSVAFTIRITNTSSAPLSNIRIQDVIPEGLTISGTQPPNIGAYNPSNKTYTFNKNTLGGHETYSLEIIASPDNTITSQRVLTNYANVDWYPSLSLTSKPVTVTVRQGGSLQLLKTDGNNVVNPNQTLTYTVYITNNGSLGIDFNKPILVTDTFLSNIQFVDLLKDGLDIVPESTNGDTRVWKIRNQSLPPGSRISFRVITRVSGNAKDGDSTINTVQATAYDYENNFLVGKPAVDENTVNLVPTTNVSIVKSVSPEQAKVGDTFTFQIAINNTGNREISNIIVNDYFPDVLELLSATTSRGTAMLNTSTREVEVRIPTMNPTEKTTIVISARVNASVKTAKTYRNRAYIKWAGVPELGSNSAAYRVLPSGMLPGTGAAGPLQISNQGGSLLLTIGGLLLLIGLVLLTLSIYMKRNHPLRAASCSRIGFLLVFCALIAGGAAALQTIRLNHKPAELSMLSGEKPPFATSRPTLPTSTIPPAEGKTRKPPIPTIEEEESSGELLDIRPTPESGAHEQPGPTPTLTSGEIDISHLLPTPTPSVLPDYPIPTPPALAAAGLDGGEPDNTAINRLVIPMMGLDAIVKYVPFNGSTWLISGLKHEIAWMGDTSWPGLGGNTGLAGHVDLVTGAKGPFWNLRYLKPGDEVQVFTEKKQYTYRVSKQQIVEDTDLSVIQPNDKPQLTLITCTGWDTNLRVYLKRLVVFAELIQVKPLTSATN